jgi:hypothetical protein
VYLDIPHKCPYRQIYKFEKAKPRVSGLKELQVCYIILSLGAYRNEVGSMAKSLFTAEEYVSCREDVLDIMRRGNNCRAIASTRMNAVRCLNTHRAP